MYIGSKVLLRAYNEEDIEKVLNFVNDFEVKKFLDLNIPFPISKREEEIWIKKNREINGLTYDFAIEEISTGNIIGGCSINSVNIKNRNCTIGIMIGDKNYWGKGYGYDALSILIKFIFEECNMEKIKLGAFSFNERAINCYKKLGFKEEGVLKKEIYRCGKYYDEIVMAMFKDEYFNRCK